MGVSARRSVRTGTDRAIAGPMHASLTMTTLRAIGASSGGAAPASPSLSPAVPGLPRASRRSSSRAPPSRASSSTRRRPARPPCCSVCRSTSDRLSRPPKRPLPACCARTREFVDDIACDRRKGPWLECIGAVVTSEITRAGPIEVATDGSRLLLHVPLAYDISARGHGWARLPHRPQERHRHRLDSLRRHRSRPPMRLDARLAGDLVWSEKTVPVLKGKLALGAHRRRQDQGPGQGRRGRPAQGRLRPGPSANRRRRPGAPCMRRSNLRAPPACGCAASPSASMPPASSPPTARSPFASPSTPASPSIAASVRRRCRRSRCRHLRKVGARPTPAQDRAPPAHRDRRAGAAAGGRRSLPAHRRDRDPGRRQVAAGQGAPARGLGVSRPATAWPSSCSSMSSSRRDCSA